MSKPERELVDGDTIPKRLPGKRMSKHMRRNVSPGFDDPPLLCAIGRSLYPVVRRGPRAAEQPAAQVAVLDRDAKGLLKLRMHRHNALD